MDRKRLLKKALQRGHLLTVKNRFYREWIRRFIIDEIKGDIGRGDITSNAVLKDKRAKAVVFSRCEGIAAGIEEVCLLLKESGIHTRQLRKDGESIKKGTEILLLEGDEKGILRTERAILDVLSRMSGISTLTSQLIKKIKNKVPIASTRKIEWRYLDKKAVYVGGGLTHRLALWESMLIKDNHLEAIKKEGLRGKGYRAEDYIDDYKDYIDDYIGEAITRAWSNRKKGIFIEVETATREEAVSAAEKFKKLLGKSEYPCLVMLDNIKPAEIIRIIAELKKKGLLSYVLLEASGGINQENIEEYAKTGVDVLSLGCLTTSPTPLDMKLRII